MDTTLEIEKKRSFLEISKKKIIKIQQVGIPMWKNIDFIILKI